MQEKRRYDRIPPEQRVTCRILEGQAGFESENDMLVKDITPAGILFESHKEITIGTQLVLEITFPFSTSNSKGSVLGKVAHCEKNSDTQKFEIGISYIAKS